MPFERSKPLVIPTTDGKLIEEHHGLVATANPDYSVARMVAPPGWSEPFQTPEFDEFTIVISGTKRFEIDGKVLDLGPNETILIKAGTRVRYSNPFDEPVHYWAICIPAFSLDTVHREE